MISNLLFRDFALLLSAPNGVSRLRKLILQLALSGKFTLQNPSDEPANELLERIKDELRDLGQPKKKQSEFPPIDLTALPKLPEGWIWTTPAEISLLRSGQTPKNLSSSTTTGDIPFFKVSDMNSPGNEKLLLSSKTTLSHEDVLTFRVHIQEAGTVVFPKIGGAIATNKRRILAKPSAYDANIMGIRIPILPAEFVYYWLSPLDLSSLSDGTVVPQINRPDILPLPFPLPPLAEQKRIISKIDLLMALCDDLDSSQQQEKIGCIRLGTAILTALENATNAADLTRFWSLVYQHFESLFDCVENVTALREAILQLAFRGELVRQDPNDEPANVLIKRIRAERNELAREQSRKVRAEEGGFKTRGESNEQQASCDEEGPFNIPNSWTFAKLGDVSFVTKLAGFEYTKHVQYTQNPDIPVIRAQNIQKYGFSPGNFVYVGRHLIELLPRSRLFGGEILMVYVGAGLGNVGIMPVGNEYFLGPNVALIRLTNTNVDTKFLDYYLRSSLGRKCIFGFSKATAQNSIKMSHIRNIWVPIPPLAEQRRIVAKIEQLLQLCDKLEDTIQRSQVTASSFADSITKVIIC
jgi:type I restriction enzyme S subunit